MLYKFIDTTDFNFNFKHKLDQYANFIQSLSMKKAYI